MSAFPASLGGVVLRPVVLLWRSWPRLTDDEPGLGQAQRKAVELMKGKRAAFLPGEIRKIGLLDLIK